MLVASAVRITDVCPLNKYYILAELMSRVLLARSQCPEAYASMDIEALFLLQWARKYFYGVHLHTVPRLGADVPKGK